MASELGQHDSAAVYEQTGASFLAAQPPVGPDRDTDKLAGWGDLRSHLENRLVGMRSWRLSWQEHWALLAEYLLPRRNLWLTQKAGTQPSPNSMVRGLPINQTIIDPTGTQAARVCASGMMSGLTSPSRPWFKMKAKLNKGKEIDQDGQIWLDAVETGLYSVMDGSNFYDSLAQMDEDCVVYGTSPLIIYEDEQDTIRCYNPVCGEYFLASSSAGRVESMYRQFVYTVAQMVEMFGVANCPRDVQELWATKGAALETERIVAHAIEPNFSIKRKDGSDAEVLKGDFVYREVYWVWGSGSDKPMSVRGFREPPFIAPRWAVTSNDPYGRSPGMDVLPDTMQLQVETRRKAEAIEKHVRPPLLASMDMKNEPSSALPGHVTYVNNLGPGAGMKPMFEVNPDISALSADILAIQQRIKSGFFNDLFLMLSQATKDMTAYEVAQRQQEKLQVLGPVIERFQNEALAPAIKRIIGIMARKQMLPPPPPSILKTGVKIEYISMLALAQKATATAGIERIFSIIGSVSALDPTAKDNIDFDEGIREYNDLLGNSPKLIRSEDQVQALRAQAAKAQQQQQSLQTSMAAVQGAQVLSKTDTGGGQNALAMMLGNAGSGAPQGG